PLSALRYFGPPTLPQGKILINLAPSEVAAISSVGVRAPGMANLPRAAAVRSTAAEKAGLTRNSAPASIQASACSDVSTVPAPVSTLLPYCRTTLLITAGASGTVVVISTMGIP